MAAEEHRCAECRRRFEPERSAEKTQRVCGEECRKKRRRRLARRRRSKRVLDARVDERERQRRCRAKRQAACGPPSGGDGQQAGRQEDAADTPVTGGCHAPASGRIGAELHEKVLESWDRAVALSRASLQRRMEGILRGLDVNSG
jgi:hypothetical protein